MENSTNKIPYFQIYAVDFIALSNKISGDDLKQLLLSISDLCMFGENNFKPKDKYQEVFYEKLIQDLEKNKKKYYSSISNGKMGGRPSSKNNPQVNPWDNPPDNLWGNPDHNQQKQKQNIKQNIKQKNNINIISSSSDNEEYEKVQEVWNDLADELGLVKIIKLNERRISAINARIKEKEFDFNKIIELIKESDFLRGNTGWKISFDWIFLSKNNYLKILEGNYTNREKGECNGKKLGIDRKDYESFIAGRS